MSSLLREVNLKATASNVRDFFNDQLDRYLALSGKHRADLKSPVSDGQPSGSPVGNSTENRMMNIWLAEQIVDCVGKAMCNCTKKSQQLLLGRYADDMLAYQVAMELNISTATFSRDQIYALNEFADRYEYQLVLHHIQDEVRDLHIYYDR
ncbi:ArpU family phage packaging/lysis transcriptional regulator [Limosilactobacillus coleohominis]|uniref:ArpU family phage packaging/lysis transcriptional regulator n=1 Tax=Limosilactobacillus coleohominis TaxID=181675 RepID=UPI001958881D|nr:ArpU family transcriptional regulator [Limosilactobacillus coleohominis]